MFFRVRIELRSQKGSDETKVDMTEEEHRERVLTPYELGRPIIINGKTIRPDDIERVKVSRSERPSSDLIRQLKDEDSQSRVVMVGEPSYAWRAAERAEDITDDVIKGPPGHRASEHRGNGVGREGDGENSHPSCPRRVFVVHGHDLALKSDVETFLRGIGLEPIVLHRQPDEGLTVIEKFERYSDVGFAVVLLTPDDIAFPAAQAEKDCEERDMEFRARQNVIFELGYFAGKLGRANVCCIYKEGVALPSDLAGMLYKQVCRSIDEIGYGLIKELKNAGLEVRV